MILASCRWRTRDGLVTRNVYAEAPPRGEYELPPLGHTLPSLIHRSRARIPPARTVGTAVLP
ncbi:winged helix-turn-helix transcriptional regulator [Streptomyces sp. NPDC051286]|uniref:winged helix-turn-helix transcriptional regulator n=1 Tax=Streptomyces sp. NPDC051286 TaxID=3365647 RepID=UPI00378C9739